MTSAGAQLVPINVGAFQSEKPQEPIDSSHRGIISALLGGERVPSDTGLVAQTVMVVRFCG